MKNPRLSAAASNPNIIRLIYVLLALLAMALAGGAPSGFGPG